ncbi:MAG: hypothetical protein WDO15_15725 [Bacteroidota bacterium]
MSKKLKGQRGLRVACLVSVVSDKVCIMYYRKHMVFKAEIKKICVKHPDKKRPIDASYFTLSESRDP